MIKTCVIRFDDGSLKKTSGDLDGNYITTICGTFRKCFGGYRNDVTRADIVSIGTDEEIDKLYPELTPPVKRK